MFSAKNGYVFNKSYLIYCAVTASVERFSLKD
jgi:hypothetical protein